MTQQTEKPKRQERQEQFKLKDVEMRYRVDDDGGTQESYNVVVYPRFRKGWSDYTREMFIWGDDPKATFEALGKQKGTVVTLNIVSGRVKQNKQDDGQFESYFWNVVGIADDQQSPPAPPQGGSQARAAPPSAASKPQEVLPKPDWDYTDVQARISWAQAINLAVEAMGQIGFDEPVQPPLYMKLAEIWANRFYPLIRKGPTFQEEPLFSDAQEGPQEAPDGGEEAEETLGGVGESPFHAAIATPKATPAVGHEHRDQKQGEPSYSYFFFVARDKPHQLTPTAALAALGVGAWAEWEKQHGKQALAEAMRVVEG